MNDDDDDEVLNLWIKEKLLFSLALVMYYNTLL